MTTRRELSVNLDRQIQSSQIGSALVRVHWNVQHRDIKLPKSWSTRFPLITAVMVAVPTGGPTGCPVSPLPLFPQNIQLHEESPGRHRAQGAPLTTCLTLAANSYGKEKVKGKTIRIQSSRIRFAVVCVRQNEQHRELKILESTRFLLSTFVIVAVSSCGPTGVSPPALSSQNIQSHKISHKP